MGKVENTRAEQHWMVPAMEKKKKTRCDLDNKSCSKAVYANQMVCK